MPAGRVPARPGPAGARGQRRWPGRYRNPAGRRYRLAGRPTVRPAGCSRGSTQGGSLPLAPGRRGPDGAELQRPPSRRPPSRPRPAGQGRPAPLRPGPLCPAPVRAAQLRSGWPVSRRTGRPVRDRASRGVVARGVDGACCGGPARAWRRCVRTRPRARPRGGAVAGAPTSVGHRRGWRDPRAAAPNNNATHRAHLRTWGNAPEIRQQGRKRRC